MITLPKRWMSRLFGRFARHSMSKLFIPLFIKLYRVDVNEVDKSVDTYETLVSFFTRRLKEGARPLLGNANHVVSPVDGTIGACGAMTGQTLLQAKGNHYTLDELLGDREQASYFAGGDYVTIYLSPRDYHRIHSPFAGYVSRLHYFPGDLYPVNERAVRLVERVFVINERLVTYLNTAKGKLAIAKIGATNVGSIRVSYDDTVGTNTFRAKQFIRNYESPIPLDKGEELGFFELGSTVIVIFPPGIMTLLPHIKQGQQIRVGQPIAQIVERERGDVRVPSTGADI